VNLRQLEIEFVRVVYSKLRKRIVRPMESPRLFLQGAGIIVVFFALVAQGTGTPPDAGEAIINIVRTSGVQFYADDVPAWLIENQEYRNAAYLALKKFLLQEPRAGDDWRNAIDAIGVIGGSSKDLAEETFVALKNFAIDTDYYGSDHPLPGSPRISEAAAAAKAEVPSAMGLLGHSAAKAGLPFHSEITKFFIGAQKPEFWKDSVEWVSESYVGEASNGKAHSAAMLAHQASLAADKFRAQISSRSKP
jgi:hypothetical protein